jgi:arginyl-tRNA--protein-N-Asp/Glu arginylyltransferase
MRGLPVGSDPRGRFRARASSQKRVMRRNESLVRSARSAWATEEQYALFRRYLDARHADGGMADMDVFEFAAMIEETPVKTRVVEYRDRTARMR